MVSVKDKPLRERVHSIGEKIEIKKLHFHKIIILDFVISIFMGMYEVKPEHTLCQQSMPLKGIDTH